jgi:hypothetical protein
MILRKMAIKSHGLDAFDYATFKDELSATKFTSGQDGPMKLRLDLLESFMKSSKTTSKILANTENDFLAGTPGSLTIVGRSLRHTLDREWKAVLSQSSIAPICQHINVAKPRS